MRQGKKTPLQAGTASGSSTFPVRLFSPEPRDSSRTAHRQGPELPLARSTPAWTIFPPAQRTAAVTTRLTPPSLQRMSDIEYKALGHAWGKSTVDAALLRLAKTKEAATRDETFDQLVADTANVTDAAVTSEVDRMEHTGQEEAAFEGWLQNGTKPERMNCWEYVLYMGVQWGLLSRLEVRAIYVDEYGTLTTARALEIFSERICSRSISTIWEL